MENNYTAKIRLIKNKPGEIHELTNKLKFENGKVTLEGDVIITDGMMIQTVKNYGE